MDIVLRALRRTKTQSYISSAVFGGFGILILIIAFVNRDQHLIGAWVSGTLFVFSYHRSHELQKIGRERAACLGQRVDRFFHFIAPLAHVGYSRELEKAYRKDPKSLSAA